MSSASSDLPVLMVSSYLLHLMPKQEFLAVKSRLKVTHFLAVEQNIVAGFLLNVQVLCRYRTKWNIDLQFKPVFLGGIMQASGE